MGKFYNQIVPLVSLLSTLAYSLKVKLRPSSSNLALLKVVKTVKIRRKKVNFNSYLPIHIVRMLTHI